MFESASWVTARQAIALFASPLKWSGSRTTTPPSMYSLIVYWTSPAIVKVPRRKQTTRYALRVLRLVGTQRRVIGERWRRPTSVSIFEIKSKLCFVPFGIQYKRN